MSLSDDDEYNSSIHSKSSSSSSDDEFLTSTGGVGRTDQDREALVRKKLLESFYGAAAVRDENDARRSVVVNAKDNPDSADAKPETDLDSDGDQNNDDPILRTTSEPLTQSTFRSPSDIPPPFTATKSDLDSPSFRPFSHTLSHIAHSSAQTLLETDERLALDIRHLDSTMQTLVYENYSKFINATDAIKSIGTNVTTAGVASLDRLQLAMERIQTASIRSEQLLRSSREAVAEKLRIQRLLVRLDALLCLPATLRNYIEKGQWRMAVKAHKSATEILGRHSAGFESLRSIEEECAGILKELVKDLREKLLAWSGRDWTGGSGRNASFSSDGVVMTKIGADSIAEIFECAGTLFMLYGSGFCPGLDGSECRKLALEACGNFLKERLEPIAREDSLVSTPVGSFEAPGDLREKTESDDIIVELPVSFLDGLLEATTLYGVSFPDAASKQVGATEADGDVLGKFITTNFDKFIARVRVLLIQRSVSHDDVNSCRSTHEEEESNEDANFRQISLALSHLVRSVRELASGLALPEVGLDVSIASTLVDQAVELTEMLVRRRVAMKFYGLRDVVVRQCLAPLVKQIVGVVEDAEDEQQPPLSLVEMIQLANVALSDGLQMADDLIRATLQRSETSDGTHGVDAPVDSAVVKLAVQKNARLFGSWLASSLEVLVGYEPSDDDDALLEVYDEDNTNDANSKRIVLPEFERDDDFNTVNNSSHSFSRKISSDDSTRDACTSALNDLLLEIDDEITDQAYSNFLLAICEMCRLAERNIANTLNQSIQSAMEHESRIAESANKLFATTINPYRKGKDVLDAEMVLAQRFKLAASRALAMYIMNRGAHASSELCKGMDQMSDTRDPYAIPSCPREECLKVFEAVKVACEDCISIFGGDLFSAPLAPFPEDQEYSDVFGKRMTQHADKAEGSGASRGLQLDVERMFIEKTQVYPHSLDEVALTRNNVVSGIFRVALSAFLECVRSTVFSSLGYRQMKVDAILMRYLLPHFVKDEFGTPEASACTCLFNIIDDIMLKAGQRCVDPEVVGDDDYYDAEKDEIVTPYFLVRQCLLGGEKEDEGDISVLKRVTFS
ncbi:hypothetical protein HJC23_010227 [Cyclotella cryptica]|uniref:Vacuolar protein sorting-associated protein 51 homolog n=1 Tax=Cyclotella cryptica TaxID=29204 RepID=A0ABD3Q0C7_9STRA|eukprot:CCRYP_009822-RA/>CCRYP_009822-RA protein AED:0.25 eAED:0.25 QI:0/-1/0/1/-1/1/1/0/1078